MCVPLMQERTSSRRSDTYYSQSAHCTINSQLRCSCETCSHHCSAIVMLCIPDRHLRCLSIACHGEQLLSCESHNACPGWQAVRHVNRNCAVAVSERHILCQLFASQTHMSMLESTMQQALLSASIDCLLRYITYTMPAFPQVAQRISTDRTQPCRPRQANVCAISERESLQVTSRTKRENPTLHRYQSRYEKRPLDTP
jgi:hypothetical protein